MRPARRRSRASCATSRSSSTSCWQQRASSARTRWPPATTSSCASGPAGPELYRARDADRDQSYFLFATTRAQLDWLRFPLGGYRQGRGARAGARSFALPVADKSDSQDICFVPQGRYTSVIERLKPGAAEAGDIVHVDGRVLGRHAGIINYTIGQRRGLGVPGPAPLYVVRLDAATTQWWSVRARACMRTGSPLGT